MELRLKNILKYSTRCEVFNATFEISICEIYAEHLRFSVDKVTTGNSGTFISEMIALANKVRSAECF